MASNSLGTTHASAYLDVVETLPEPDKKRLAPNNEWYGILVMCLLVSFVFALIIIIFVWKKYTKTKKLQRRLEKVSQWTKKVIVVQPCIDNGSPGISDSLVNTREFFLFILKKSFCMITNFLFSSQANADSAHRKTSINDDGKFE